MNKADYRKVYKKKRIDLSAKESETLNKCIYDQLTAMDWSKDRFVHVYIPIAKFNEPDTLDFVSYLKTNYPGIGIVISKTDFVDSTMLNYLWDGQLVLEESKWGILEPLDGKLIEESEIDVVLVPMLVADLKGNRVGYGKGFYDRFLSKCRSSVKTIGLSFFEPVDKIDDVENWDIPVDILVTPFGSFQFK